MSREQISTNFCIERFRKKYPIKNALKINLSNLMLNIRRHAENSSTKIETTQDENSDPFPKIRTKNPCFVSTKFSLISIIHLIIRFKQLKIN